MKEYDRGFRLYPMSLTPGAKGEDVQKIISVLERALRIAKDARK